MRLFRKKLSNYDWLAAILPLFNEQERLVNQLDGTMTGEVASEITFNAFLQLSAQTSRNAKDLNGIGPPAEPSGREVHVSFRESLKLWELATRNGRRYFGLLADEIASKAHFDSKANSLPSADFADWRSSFLESLSTARESLVATGRMIDRLESDLMATMAPSQTISTIPFGKDLLNHMEGVATLLDADFEGWDPPPYTLLTGKLEYDECEQAEIERATEAHMKEWSNQLDQLANEHRAEAHEAWVARPGVEAGLLEAAAIKCRKNGDYQGALESWFKRVTHRERSYGPDPDNQDAWVLLTEIYIGKQNIVTAKKALLFTILSVATELEKSASLMERELVRSHQLPKWLEPLDRLRHGIETLVTGSLD